MEPIAVIGLGCRFPQADHPEAFWQLLQSGGDAVRPIPENRWDVEVFYDPDPNKPTKMSTRWAAMLNDVDHFDANFFGLSADEVEHTDPQQRLFLEVAWEAFEHAGIVPGHLAGSHTGVFIGLCTVDYHRLLYRDYACIGPYSGTGTTPCIAANRLSYLLDLRGPSMAVDTACSSSLTTVHLACQSLRSGESDLCVAGGVNLILSPDSTISSSQMRMLSPRGRCNTFDARADGYVRGEGCGVVILKRLADAQRDGDRILALIRGSAMNQDGLSNSLTAPNGLAQQAVMRRALDNAGVQPQELSYVEAHAVGTALGDAIEFKALKSVLMEGRSPDQPCWIGSAKPNIGHLEAASGMAALIKVILSLYHEAIPAHLYLEQLNPYISLENTPLAIPTQSQPWPRGATRRIAGVNAFGFGGTNAHVVVEEGPLCQPRPQGALERDRPYHLFTLAAKSEAALVALAQRYDDFLATQDAIALPDICFSANTERSHFDYRLWAVVESTAQLRQQLQSFIAQTEGPHLGSGKVQGRKRPKLAFRLAGAGSPLRALGRQLYATQPSFRRVLDQCATLLADDDRFTPLVEQLHGPQPVGPVLGFALEYSLVQLWQTWGIVPQAVAGVGWGEYTAACIGGVLSLETTLAWLAHLQSSDLGSPSGDDRFWAMAQATTYAAPRLPILSGVTGQSVTEAMGTPDYWRDRRSCSSFLEVEAALPSAYQWLAPDGRPLGGQATASAAELADQGAGPAAYQGLLTRLGSLYGAGYAIDWVGFDQGYGRQRLPLPTYPFQRQRYWFKPLDAEAETVAPATDRPSRERLSLEESAPEAQIHELAERLAKLPPHSKAS